MDAAQATEIKKFPKKLKKLSDDDLLSAWHQAVSDQNDAPDGSKDFAFARKMQAEAEAIMRFGLGDHLRKLKEKFCDDD